VPFMMIIHEGLIALSAQEAPRLFKT